MSMKQGISRSMQFRNFRLYFFGSLVSGCGTWMQTIALGWLVLDLSHQSGLAVGFLIALQFAPTLLFGVWAGTIADRVDKRTIQIITQLAMAAIAALLAVLDFTGVVQLWMLYVVIFVAGIAFALDNPSRTAFITELVPAPDIPNAIGLTSAVIQSARVVGPALAGAVIVTLGTAACFALNAASFVFLIAALLAIRPAELHRSAPVARAKGQIREGLRYMWRTAELRRPLLVALVVGTFAINSPVIIPLLARVTFGGDANVYSWMSMAAGGGALVGALVWASWAHARAVVLFLSTLAYGIAICVTSAAPTLAICIGLLVVVGATQTAFLATATSVIQIESEPSMRGRVTAVYTIAVVGTTPIGGPMIGWISEQFGPRWGFGIGGIASIAAAAVYGVELLRDHRRKAVVGATPAFDEDVVFGIDGEVIPASIK